MVARTREAEVPCPGCAVVSNRVHSTYGRSPIDTPVGDRSVLIELTVRRLYCENVRCSRRTVAEQVEGLTVRYSGRTPATRRVGGCRRRARGPRWEPSCRCPAYTGEPIDTVTGGYGPARSCLDRSEGAGRR
ncbi:transposase family protein [Streptomyces sp. NBC_01799]|uniref:transposase family protein n=1 Tax=Streptomyces sp. NBC_01800 TaxID=2975945 RepID=UPI002DD7EDF9|nr:transposase family protein [Streptomyces sp. NBC_01800]WSA74066.1 transposase family protein [Streptomyces sp. NBC_01800]WSA82572.1 transposase family protein [Streptomyces sp. NBC_01799]